MAQKLDNAIRSLGIHESQSGCAIGARWVKTSGKEVPARSPIDGGTLATVTWASTKDVNDAVKAAHEAFLKWREVPAPKRGEFVRRLGEKLRQRKKDLGALVTLEAGKITQEALGEVQEMIDICDFAVGLSRQLYGLTIASERPGHRMMEQWHPLGVVGVITAFNFPVAVWAWNAMLALVCGDTLVWKPSEKTPLTAVACQNILQEVVRESSDLNVPDAVSNVVIGDGASVGAPLAASQSVPQISATGSTRMGQQVAQAVAARLGRCLLELGGNNAMILTPSADQELAVRAITFAAAGGAALAPIAAFFGAGEADVFAQRIEQRHARLERQIVIVAVDIEPHLHRCARIAHAFRIGRWLVVIGCDKRRHVRERRRQCTRSTKKAAARRALRAEQTPVHRQKTRVARAGLHCGIKLVRRDRQRGRARGLQDHVHLAAAAADF